MNRQKRPPKLKNDPPLPLQYNKGYEALKDESNYIFYSPSTTFIPMSASFYSEARDDGKKRQEMLELVNLSNFRRDSDKYKDNEDNIAFIFNFMHYI